MSISSEAAVHVRGLGKAYRISHLEQTQQPTTASTKTSRWPWLRRSTGQKLSRETFWALKDIDFDVPCGQVFGIIGRNGAGKSTLLKILSRITEPTSGFAQIQGRVGSLLEVGTGFHPELTGRENIYLNGTLLGMRRRQIDRVFDEIVAFAEVERFIDTPVKRYSSGMYVRLAFAVAAHLQPDVLIIDEVLSVGDAIFQEKCLGRMQSLSSAGRTVIFVSHNMDAVAALCDRAIVLHDGLMYFDGPPQDAADAYYELCKLQNPPNQIDYRERGGSSPYIIQTVSSEYSPPKSDSEYSQGVLSILIIGKIQANTQIDTRSLLLAIGINQENGTRLGTYVASEADEKLELQNGLFSYIFRISDLPLQPGTYWVDISLLSREETVDCLQRCSSFRIPQPTSVNYQSRDPAWGSVKFACSGYNSKAHPRKDS